MGARVVADQHRAEARGDPLLAQAGDPLGELGLDRRQGGGAVEGSAVTAAYPATVTIELSDARYGDALTAALIEEIQQEMIARYGGPDETPVDPAQFAALGGAFLVAHVDGEPIGCAGLRGRPAGEVELKRMYVRPAHRRRGYARGLLLAVEDRARSLGYRRLVLETGTAQPEAIALYEREGYLPTAGFGHYADEPGSRYYAKDL